MSKELEVLKRMKENSYYVDDKNLKEDVGILEQALLELKAIKEANPSKAMESLERIDKEYATIENEDFKICFNTIKQALKRLEAIDNSNPSKALKYVNGKIADLEDDLQHYTMVEKDKCKEFFIREDLKQFTTIKQALIKAQEQEKILSVILKKRIDLESFYSTFVKDDLDYKYYEKYYGTYGLEKLTQEEFDLLKEVFCND